MGKTRPPEEREEEGDHDEEGVDVAVAPGAPGKKVRTVLASAGTLMLPTTVSAHTWPGLHLGSEGANGPRTEIRFWNSGRSCRALPPRGCRAAASR